MRTGVMYERVGVPLEFDYLTRHQSFEQLRGLARHAYGSEPRSTHMDEELWRAFPRGYVGGWIDGALHGVIQLWPLDGQRAGDFLVGARSEQALTSDDFATVCNSPTAVWYFSGLLIHPDWRDRGLGAHLLAEAMARWHRDLPFRTPVRFAALAASDAGLGFIHGFGMELIRPDTETVDRMHLYGRTFQTETAMFDVVRAAREAADRKGRLLEKE